MDLRQQLFRYRSYTPIPFLIMMIIFAHPTPGSSIIGFCIVAAGEFIRLWGVAIAGSETRTTGPVGGTNLITTGPFSYVRNPLYLGNMLMYFGIGIMSNALMPWLPWIALLYFLFQYSLIVNLEEEYLMRTFGNDFVRYSKEVPRFAPALKKYNAGTHHQPELNWQRGARSERRTFQAILLITLLLIVVWKLRG